MMLTARVVLKALRTRFVDQRPFILSHLITARCNADCVTCLWKMPASAATDEMSTAEVQDLYRDAADAGFRFLVLWGGEPLVRPDTGEALRAARGAGLKTTLITNGWWLEERADEVLPWTDRLMVSVDGIGTSHDQIRRLPGLFERLEAGLARTRDAYPGVSVIVNTVLSRLNLDQLEAIAEFGRRHGTRVSFQAMDVTDYGFGSRKPVLHTLQLDAREAEEVAGQIGRLRDAGYPVTDSATYLARIRRRDEPYHCHFKKVCLRVEPNGEVLDCTRDASPLCSVRGSSLADVARSDAYRQFLRRAELCNRCRDYAVVEISHLWEGRGEALWNAVRTLT